MPDLVNYKPIDFNVFKNNINAVIHNPSSIKNAILTGLSDATNGLMNIVDPSNPFIFSLETLCVGFAAAVDKMDINTSKQYSKLASTYDDLYMHMSDTDFVNKFATPSNTTFTIMMEMDSFNKNAIDSPIEKCFKVIIPRNSVFGVNGVEFSIQYPIVVKMFYNGLYQVSYDNTVTSPLQTLASNIIDFKFRNDSNNISSYFIAFDVPVQQFNIINSQATIQQATYFSHNVQFNDMYYYTRVYYQNNNTNGKWIEIPTTFSKQVFDPLVPTAILKVINGNVNITIPQVYVNNGLISGTIRMDVYQTKGNLVMDLSKVNMHNFKTNYLTYDTSDSNAYSQVMRNVITIVYSDKLVNSGVNSIPFETLRNNVINNTAGKINIPITNAQLDSIMSMDNFNLIKNIDTITNRSLLAVQSLPTPINTNLITPMCLAMNTLVTSFKALKDISISTDIRDNTNTQGSLTVGRITITPNTLYLNTNNQIKIVPDQEVMRINSLPLNEKVKTINTSDYIFTPFYYVLDNTNDEFSVSAYYLDNPISKDINFVSQNTSINLTANTNSYTLVNNGNGYVFSISIKSDTTHSTFDDSLVGVQLAFTPIGQTQLVYLNGVLRNPEVHVNTPRTTARIYDFIISTNYDIDNNDNIVLTSFRAFVKNYINTITPLSSTFTILHYLTKTPINFIADQSNNLLGLDFISKESVVITEEKVNLVFGTALNNLWVNSRSMANYNTFQTYTSDVYLTYDKDVYANDPTTNSIFTITNNQVQYNVLHKAGDLVLDNKGNKIKLHSIGDVVIDPNTNKPKPLALNDIDTLRSIDIMFMEGAYYFTDEQLYVDYKKEVNNTIVNWITNSLPNIQKVTLEKTVPYFYPQKTMGLIKALGKNNTTVLVEARQSFILDFYVTNAIIIDEKMKNIIKNRTVIVINSLLNNKTFSISDCISNLRLLFGSNVLGINMRGLGGINNNFEILTVINKQESLSINKLLVNTLDGVLITTEDVIVNFFEYQQ